MPDSHLRAKVIHFWFEHGAQTCSGDGDIHKCSQWQYLSEHQFNDVIADGINLMPTALKDGDNIFEMGMGVGAFFKPYTQQYPNLRVSGSDYAESAINKAKKLLPDHAERFYVHDMTKPHDFISDNTFDHVFSFGALAMYLSKDEMVVAMEDAIRMTKPGGSIVVTHFIEPGASPQGSIRTAVEKDFWYKLLPNMGVDNITITTMKHQGSRYQIVCRKTIEA